MKRDSPLYLFGSGIHFPQIESPRSGMQCVVASGSVIVVVFFVLGSNCIRSRLRIPTLVPDAG